MENIGLIVAAVVAVLFVILLAISYVKAPPDMAYIISGLKRRTVIGAAKILEKKEK